MRVRHLFTVFTLAAGLGLLPAQIPAQTFTTLHSFSALNSSTNDDGAFPWPALVLSSNTLYGTTYNGGASSNGTVFAVNTDGSGFTNLHTFSGRFGVLHTNSDGAQPVAGLVLISNILYGTTGTAGPSGRGTIYALNTDGTGFTNLHTFKGNTDGAATTAKLILSSNVLYGASQGGGTNGLGIVFAMNTDGSGYTNLHNFATYINGTNSEGSQPLAGLAVSGTNLFGTGWSGGVWGNGAVFRINTDGTGFTNLHSFTAMVSGTNSDGATPFGGLTVCGDTLYGVTLYGGAGGNGTLFKFNADGSGFTNFHSFTALINNTNSDGASPYGSLFLSGNTLYGTAPGGGALSNGTVFVVNTDGTGFKVLYNFTSYENNTNSDGGAPVSGILSSNTLYGMAHLGGDGGSGTIFSLFIPPPLSIGLSGANTILSWPTNADGFTLQSTTNLADPASWSAVSPAPVNLNGENVVTNPASGGQIFYRLTR